MNKFKNIIFPICVIYFIIAGCMKKEYSCNCNVWEDKCYVDSTGFAHRDSVISKSYYKTIGYERSLGKREARKEEDICSNKSQIHTYGSITKTFGCYLEMK